MTGGERDPYELGPHPLLERRALRRQRDVELGALAREVLLELASDPSQQSVAGRRWCAVGSGAGVVSLALHPDADEGVAGHHEGERADRGVLQHAVSTAVSGHRCSSHAAGSDGIWLTAWPPVAQRCWTA